MVPLRILLLEDRPSDAMLVLHELRRSGFAADWRRVESEADYLAALDPALDLILADYTLPQFDALQALRLTRARGFDIPFIIVSGSIGEEMAVAAMLEGADDYLLKDRLGRLGPAVGRALEQHRLRTENRRAEQALRASAALHQAVLHSLSAEIAVLDDAGVIVTVNEAWQRFARQNGSDLIDHGPGVNYLDVCRQAHATGGLPEAARALEGLTAILQGRAASFSMEYACHSPADEHWFVMNARALVDRRGVVVSHEDITERKRAEINLRENLALLHAVTEGTTDSVFVKDLQGRYLLINTAGAALMGRTVEQVLGQDDTALFDAESAARIRQGDEKSLAERSLRTFEETLTADAVARTFLTTKGPYYDYQGNVVGLIGISRDITERKLLEAQYITAQRMESVGRLAGGVAHDFNNLLTAIGAYAELSLETIEAEHPARTDLEEIGHTVKRAANLTRQLLAFARRQIIEPHTINLGALIADVDKLLRRLIGEDIELETRVASPTGLIFADPGQIEQVLVNLIVNARDAMPQGGKILIETANLQLDEHYAQQHSGVAPGEYMLLAVSDTGIGMTDEVKQHIFEPFFTTKEPGRGTGLGMATCYGIVKQSGGNIWIYSEPGQGTTVKIYLPRMSAAPEQALVRLPAESGAARGSETILLVEDEVAVRAVALRALQAQGYHVLEAASGVEALKIAQGSLLIDLLLTDVVMPQIDGRALADAIRELRPGISVLFMSGYTDNAVIQHGLLSNGFELLQKPFSPHQLAQRVRRCLDARQASDPVQA